MMENKKEKKMGRFLSTVNPLLLASALLLGHVSLAAENDEASDNAVVALAANVPATENLLAAPVPAEDELLHLFGLYREARDTGMWDEAEVLAKQIVELTITEYGPRSRQTAVALTDLGEMQSDNGDYRAAILNLAQAIEIIEVVDDYLSQDLLGPLNAMAHVQNMAGATDLAVQSWNRALHITHVNLGPHNYEQIETLYSLGRAYARAGASKELRKIRRRIEYLRTRDPETSFELE